MSVIKAILVVAIVVIALWSLRHRENVGLRAGGRLLMLGVGALALSSVIFPSITQDAAHAVGVGRGTDLVLYALIITFVFTSASMYFRQRDLENKMATLVRALAIHQAVTPEDLGDFGHPLDSEMPPKAPSRRSASLD